MSNASERTRRVDVAVIGAGTAGLAAYRAAAAAGARALVIEGGAHGTTCARVGCMPSKLLLAAGDAAHRAREAAPFGIRASVEVDGRSVMRRVKAERDRFVGLVLEGVERIPATDRLSGWATFSAPSVLEVSGPDGDTRVDARAIVIATGGAPVIPSMFDDVRDRVVRNDDVFAWDTLPGSVAVFGAGVIGLELGQALARLGVRVRVFGRGGAVGPLTDPVVVEAARDALQAGLAVDFDAFVDSVAREGDGVRVDFFDADGRTRSEVFETALVAAGRKPNLEALGLEASGVPPGAKLDRRTLHLGANVFVAGDANGDVPFLHEAADEGSIAGANAARFPDLVPSPRRSPLAIAFSDPQLAVVGASHAELSARSRSREAEAPGARGFVAGHVSFVDQGRSRVMRENHGALRVYADAASRRLLGAEIAGPRAEHLAHLCAWAHQQELTIDQMLAMPFYHPVVEEGLRTALRDAKTKLDHPKTLEERS